MLTETSQSYFTSYICINNGIAKSQDTNLSCISKPCLIIFFSHLVNKLTVFTFIRFICLHVSLFNFATWDSAKNAFYGITNLFLRFRFYSIQTLQTFVISILFYFCMLQKAKSLFCRIPSKYKIIMIFQTRRVYLKIMSIFSIVCTEISQRF